MRWGGGEGRGSASSRETLPYNPLSAGSSPGGEGIWGTEQWVCNGVGFRLVLIIYHSQLGNLGQMPYLLCTSAPLSRNKQKKTTNRDHNTP